VKKFISGGAPPSRWTEVYLVVVVGLPLAAASRSRSGTNLGLNASWSGFFIGLFKSVINASPPTE
jgi:hypothetical protein